VSEDEKSTLESRGHYYMCRGIPFYPHYKREYMYVGPGGVAKSELELIGLGAARNKWKRRPLG